MVTQWWCGDAPSELQNGAKINGRPSDLYNENPSAAP